MLCGTPPALSDPRRVIPFRNGIIYMWISLDANLSYIGQTIQTFQDRMSQHRIGIYDKLSKEKDIPMYRILRSRGGARYVPIPLFSVANPDDSTMRFIESQVIHTFRPKMNMPFCKSLSQKKNWKDSGTLVSGRVSTGIMKNKSDIRMNCEIQHCWA